MIRAINDFEGAVIIISHERHLIETCADRLWLVREGTVMPFEGDMDDYAALVLGRGEAPRREEAPIRKPQPAARPSPQTARRRIAEIERAIDDIRQKIEVLDRALADPLIYSEEPKKAADFARLRARLALDLDAAETRWLESHEVTP